MTGKQYLKHCLRLLFLKGVLALKERQTQITLCAIADDHIGVEIFANELYEKETLFALKNFLQQKSNLSLKAVALDVGANIGNHTIFFSKLFKSVFSFEPNQHIADLIEVNKVLNSSQNVKVIRSAIVEKPGKYILVHPGDNVGAARLELVQDPGKSATVQVITGNEVMSQVGSEKVGLIKVDTEGTEILVFKALQPLLQRDYPVIAFEQQPEEMVNGTSECIEYLKTLGYNKLYAPEAFPNSKFKLVQVIQRLFCGRTTQYIEKTSLESQFYPLLVMLRQNA